MASLKQTIIEQAVLGARTRVAEDELVAVNTEDLMLSARQVIPGAISQLEQALTSDRPNYVRNTS